MRWNGGWRELIKSWVLLTFVLGMTGGITSISQADDAAVLGKGIFQIQSDNRFYFRTEDRFNRDGDKEPFATPFNSTIDQSVFPGLAAFSGAPFNLPSPTVGQTITDMDWLLVRTVYQVAYGLTDRLTIGVRIPWIWVKNKVDFEFDSSGANVNIGLNPGFVDPSTNPLGFAPLFAPGTVRVNTALAQQALETLGFKPLKTFERSGIEDIELGGRYQYFRNDMWRLAFTGGVRLPTGRKDDPENLADVAFGSGAYALLFRLHQDLTLFQEDSPLKNFGFLTPGAVSVNTSFHYDLYLPDHQRLRVTGINDPLGGEFDNVKRDLGDIFRAEVSPKVGLLKGLSAFGLYQYTRHFKDDYSGNKDLPYDDIAFGSNYHEHIYIVGMTFTTLPWVIENSFPVPIVATVSYRDRFASNGFLWVAKYLGLNLSVYF